MIERTETLRAGDVVALALNAGREPTPCLMLDAGTGVTIKIEGSKADLSALLIRIAGELDALNND